jgi:hypothetical protein
MLGLGFPVTVLAREVYCRRLSLISRSARLRAPIIAPAAPATCRSGTGSAGLKNNQRKSKNQKGGLLENPLPVVGGPDEELPPRRAIGQEAAPVRQPVAKTATTKVRRGA